LKRLITWSENPLQNLYFPLSFEGEGTQKGVLEGQSPSKETIFPLSFEKSKY